VWEITYDPTHEDMLEPDEMKIVGESDDDPRKIAHINKLFRQLMTAVNDFAGSFHDKFDCR